MSRARREADGSRPLLRGGIRLLTVWLAASGLAVALPPEAPGDCRATPDYAGPAIEVRWDDVEGETGYRVFRAGFPTGSFEQIGGDLPADTTSFLDDDVNSELEYLYKVRAIRGAEESGDSNLFRQNARVVWPNEDGRGLLHNWNEVLGRAGSRGTPFHRGCDVQQTGEVNDRIVFPRGGVVARVGSGGPDDNFIFVEVKSGEEIRFDSFNHLDGDDALSLGFAVGDVVRAGQLLGVIGDAHFTIETLDWIDHVHFFVATDPLTNDVDGRHPLKIFPESDLRDPFDVRPRLFDHAPVPDGTVLFRAQESPAGEYLSLPLQDDPTTGIDEADVDLLVEVADDMNGGVGTTLAPTSIAYWIQGPACSGGPPAVRSASAPYMLMKWDDRFFGFEEVDLGSLVDPDQNLAPHLVHEGMPYPYDPPPQFGWDNYKHFVITNAQGGDGDPLSIDPAQYWNTNARQDHSPTDSDHANFAGMPDATRAQDARFPDGEYTVHVRLTDLIGESAERIEPVRLENFAPALVRRWATTETRLNDETGLDYLHLEFSEPMLLPTTDRAIGLVATDGGGPLFHTEWDANGCVVSLVPSGPVDPDQSYMLTVDSHRARDLGGRGLDSEYGAPNHDGEFMGPTVESVVFEFSFAAPDEVSQLSLERTSEASTISWPTTAGAASYSVARSPLSGLGAPFEGTCLASGIDGQVFKSPEDPPPGSGFAYLVQAVSEIGRVGSLGAGSDGPRTEPGVVVCP